MVAINFGLNIPSEVSMKKWAYRTNMLTKM